MQQTSTANDVIQSMWANFDAMTDVQRNTLLKGVVKRCGETQIAAICTWLNLKFVDDDCGRTVHPESGASKYVPVPSAKPKRPKPTRADAPKGPLIGSKALSGGVVGLPPMTRHGTAVPQETATSNNGATPTNVNLYIKLLNTTNADITALADQLTSTAAPATVRAFLGYLTGRVQTFRQLLQTLGDVAHEGDEETAVAALFERASTVADATHVALYILDDAADSVVVRHSNWLPEGTRLPTPRLFAAGALMKGEMVNIYNVKTSDLFMEDLDPSYERVDPECILSAPILSAQGRVVAVIELINKNAPTPFFNDEDQFAISALASVWGLLLAAIGPQIEATHQTADLRAILDTASVMSSELDLGDLVSVIMRTVQELLNAERCSLFIVDGVRQELWTTVAQGTQEIRIPINSGIAGYVATTGKTLNIPNAYKDPRFNREIDLKTGFRTRNILCMPMRNTQGAVVGVTQIINKLPVGAVFAKDDEMLLASFSSLAGGMLDKAMLLKELQLRLQAVTLERDSLVKGSALSPVTVLTLNVGGRLVSQSAHPTLTVPAAPLPELTSYDTWLSPNTDLISDISRVFSSRATIHAVGYSFCSDGSDDPVTIDYTISPGEGDACAVVVVLTAVDADVPPLRAVRRYLAPAHAAKVLADSCQTGTAGVATILCTEMQKISELTETSEPQAVIDLLDSFARPIIDASFENDGLLTTLTASHSTTVFGCPLPAAGAAHSALTVALRLRSTLPVTMPITLAVCTGNVVTGSVGGDRGEWICTGAPLARAAVLHAQSVLYLGEARKPLVLVDDPTAQLITGSFHIRELDAVYLNSDGEMAAAASAPRAARAAVTEGMPPVVEEEEGESSAIVIIVHEVLAPGEVTLEQSMLTALICYELGLSDYRTQNFFAAHGHFNKAMQISGDAPARVMAER
ncbi:hypothetical protein HKX48_003307, partial [Thoreauomyces humboldtii]